MNKYAMSYGLHIPLVGERTAKTFAGKTSGRFWYLLPIVAIISFAVLYIVVVNHTATQGYRMREVEKYINEIRSDNKKLELKVAELQSMDSVKTRLLGQDYVPVAKIEYLSPGTPAVALK